MEAGWKALRFVQRKRRSVSCCFPHVEASCMWQVAWVPTTGKAAAVYNCAYWMLRGRFEAFPTEDGSARERTSVAVVSTIKEREVARPRGVEPLFPE